ncbi:MAG: polyphosphate kinase 2 [Magnetococcales bacterium]|nr:polyphosphate kinase 2 [Magnetococcales bacterium]
MSQEKGATKVKEEKAVKAEKAEKTEAAKPPFEELVKGREEEIIKLLKEKDYLDVLTPLQQELVKCQLWIRDNGIKVLAIFEGRDAAGKGSAIKRFTEFLNPRLCKVIALDKPTDQERGQWYFQRYVKNLPSKGEMMLFDRSWYNRAGVERVMGFCTEQQVKDFYRDLPEFERMLVNSGIHLIKFWFSASRKSQEKRFSSRETDPLKVWKLSPVDKEAQDMWDKYSDARDDMLKRTSTDYAPWTVIKSDDKKLSRINSIRYFLSQFPYTGKREELLKIDPEIVITIEEELKRR